MRPPQLSLTLLLATLVLATACEKDDDDDPAADDATEGADDEDSGSDASGSSGGDEFAEEYACVDPDLLVVMPLAGPGIDPMSGALLEPVQDTYVVSTTQILLRPEPAAQDQFFALVGAVMAELDQTEGLVGYSLASEPACGFARTLSVWASEEAMYAFVGSAAHVEAMSHTDEVGITGRVTHWQAAAAEMPPTWEQALAKIDGVEPFGSGY